MNSEKVSTHSLVTSKTGVAHGQVRRSSTRNATSPVRSIHLCQRFPWNSPAIPIPATIPASKCYFLLCNLDVICIHFMTMIYLFDSNRSTFARSTSKPSALIWVLAHIDHIGTQIIPRLAIGAALCDVPATGLPSIPSHPWRYGSKLWMLKVLLRIRGTRHWKQWTCRYFVANHCITDHSAPKPQASVVPSVVTPSGASCKRPTVGKPKTGCKCWGCDESIYWNKET